MSDMPWVRFFASDWLGGTRGMSAAETGVYITLVASMYERGEPIPEDHARLARLCGASNSAFKRILETLISEGKIIRLENGLWNDRVEKERIHSAEKSASARTAGHASARARNERNAELRKQRMKDAREKGTHTAAQWQALLTALEFKCVQCGTQGPCEKDHIVPVYQGGSDGIENLQPLCRSCKASKGPSSDDLRPENWRTRYAEALILEAEKIEEKQQADATGVERGSNGRSTNPEARSQTPEEEEKETPAALPPPTDLYAFQAQTIRLTSKHLDQWRKAYPHISLEAELWALDEWAGEQGSNWFFAVSSALAKKERTAVERINMRRVDREAATPIRVRADGRI